MAEAEQALVQTPATTSTEEPKSPEPRSLGKIISAQLETLRGYHRAVLETDDIEAVHKMRVTTRRLQASLDLLETQMKVRGLKVLLRKWRRALSRVRNYDVFLELIEKEEPARGRERKEQLQLIKRVLEERRVRRAAKVRQFLAGADIDRIGIKLGLMAATGAARSNGATEVAATDTAARVATPTDLLAVDEARTAAYAAERLEQRFAEFRDRVAASHPTNDPAELHQLRIAAKRVRYLLEVVSQMGFGNPVRALAWLRTLQDRIGDWHDMEALEEEIITIVSSRQFTKGHLSESSRMLQAAAHLQKKKEALVARLFPVRVPRYLIATCERTGRALRRRAARPPQAALPKAELTHRG
jgi:CHAD domain-containing protein